MVQPLSFSPAQAVAAPRPVAPLAAPVAFPAAAEATVDTQPPPAPAPAPQTPAAVVQIAAAAIPNAPHPYGPDAARKPLSLSVDKNDGGVFVYTLRDPDSGSVLAVIPRDVLQNPAGRQVDTRA